MFSAVDDYLSRASCHLLLIARSSFSLPNTDHGTRPPINMVMSSQKAEPGWILTVVVEPWLVTYSLGKRH